MTGGLLAWRLAQNCDALWLDQNNDAWWLAENSDA
jgi:hypothetical protein